MVIHDLNLVGEVVGDIVNIFGHAEGRGYNVSFPVGEYFSNPKRLRKPNLRTTALEEHRARGSAKTALQTNSTGPFVRSGSTWRTGSPGRP
ncbi:HpcH/HpaI aldolase/citrate lyase family protein [Humibacillus sp. DSM 29435]|uniref:HpcH/HpaI aldolase/citrate lyase family protein n=1 Tax=Humibacillus sp. DSM 29435 TaxID=1869167 RepID=UPI001586743B